MAQFVRPVRSYNDFETTFSGLAEMVRRAEPYDRGEVHAQKVTKPEMVTRELCHVSLELEVPPGINSWQSIVSPNLPWAEEHFQERVSGIPMNPPPSNERWPFARAGNAEHKDEGGHFSHTYPERFWPKMANVGGVTSEGRRIMVPHVGIRFFYGDLEDLLRVLCKNPRSRQAYLPIWFPEDLSASVKEERVPCTLGYHFLLDPRREALDVTYYMRSCDLVRFFRDDVYMAGRLLQWVATQLDMAPGSLRMHIANLHAFVGDDDTLRARVNSHASRVDPRSSYNFGALG